MYAFKIFILHAGHCPISLHMEYLQMLFEKKEN